MRSTALPWAVGSVLFPAAFSNNCPSTDGSVRQIGAPRLDAGYFFSTANGRGGGVRGSDVAVTWECRALGGVSAW